MPTPPTQTATKDAEIPTELDPPHEWTYTKDLPLAVVLRFTDDDPILISDRLTVMFGYGLFSSDVNSRAAVLRANEDGRDTWRRVQGMNRDDAWVVELLRGYMEGEWWSVEAESD